MEKHGDVIDPGFAHEDRKTKIMEKQRKVITERCSTKSTQERCYRSVPKKGINDLKGKNLKEKKRE